MALPDWLKASMSNWFTLWTCEQHKFRGSSKLSSLSPPIIVAICMLLRLRYLIAIMAKTDVSDPDVSHPAVSNPDSSVLNPSEDDTTNLNPNKLDIFKPDPPDPDLLKPAPFIAAPSPLGLGRDASDRTAYGEKR